ncbi:Uncharacterised protein [Erysipelatoclostridium ramosum]|uniref:Uncharacterized protein n=1 Tax=Thomasclavelia ramosa TaxID=1547 RepID=A0A6N2Y2C2_9FIRM|nr:hypothetical protein HMPREF0978_03248 [Coprobacillus sp. 8_2_54BFAA]EQM95695.1 hypothetical protein MBAG_03580 [Coprobacillus sp. D7]CCZ31421.1 putative uncharacterized protein [Coprobacillus sp. CAG:183]
MSAIIHLKHYISKKHLPTSLEKNVQYSFLVYES